MDRIIMYDWQNGENQAQDQVDQTHHAHLTQCFDVQPCVEEPVVAFHVLPPYALISSKV